MLAAFILAWTLVYAAGCGSGKIEPAARGTLVLGPQENCDRDLAKSPPDVTVYGADAGDYLGDRFSLATGDFNGDGRGDVLVGAPLADGAGNERKDAGEAHVLFGSSEPPQAIDLAQGAPFTVIGENAGDNLGFTVAAGDVNGGGRDDIIVGARFAQAVGQPAVGKAYVFFGRPGIGGVFDMASASADATIIGEQPGDFTSIALTTGDVNGDKIADIMLGASGSNGAKGDRQGAGKVEVVLDLKGQIDLRQSPPFLTVYGARAGDTVPNQLAAGDLDGDQRDELIIGAPFVDAENRDDAGRVYIVRVPEKGGAIDLASAGDVVQLTGGARKDAMGFEVAAADVNGDGIDDLIAGARDADGIGDTVNNSGEVHILFGRDGLPSSRDLIKDMSDVVINGSDAGDSLGFTVASGDVNGDHIADIVAGAPVADSCGNARPDGGDAYVLFGRDKWPAEISLKGAADLTFLGKKEGDEMAFSAATTHFNGDGIADTVFGALQADGPNDSRPDSGEVYVVFSRKP